MPAHLLTVGPFVAAAHGDAKGCFLYTKHARRPVIDLPHDFEVLNGQVDSLCSRWKVVNDDVNSQSATRQKNDNHEACRRDLDRILNYYQESIVNRYKELVGLASGANGEAGNQIPVHELSAACKGWNNKFYTKTFYKLARLDKKVRKFMTEVTDLKNKITPEHVTSPINPEIVVGQSAQELTHVPSHQKVLDSLVDCLRHADCKRIIIHGEPQVGKTNILKNLNNLLDQRPIQLELDYVIWVTFPTCLREPEDIITDIQDKILQRLGLTGQNGGSGKKEVISRALREKSYLLLFDGFSPSIELEDIGISEEHEHGKVIIEAKAEDPYLLWKFPLAENIELERLPTPDSRIFFDKIIADEALCERNRDLSDMIVEELGRLGGEVNFSNSTVPVTHGHDAPTGIEWPRSDNEGGAVDGPIFSSGASTAGTGGSMKLSPSIQEEHGAAQFPELSKPVLQLEDKVVSAAYPPTQMEPKATTPEVKRILQLEQVDSGSGSSQSNDTPGTAFNIQGDISSGAESGNKPPILSTNLEPTTLVSISVEGELSQFMDINLEIPRGTSLSEWQNQSNGFLRWDFLSGKESYRILARDKTVELELDRGKSSDGDYSSPEPLESFNLANSTLPKHLVFRNEGDKMKKPPNEDQWKQAGVMDLTDTFPSLPKKLYSLPQKLYSPNLVLLFLQRNPSLRPIPDSLFSAMPSLRVVDLSDNRFRTLPSSIFGLHKLQVLILRDCSFIYMFPPEIKQLEHIEVLDLLGTELEKAPDELGKLTNLRHLQISFYGTDDGRETDHLPPVLLSRETVSKLRHLEALTIVVHPEDLRWVKNAEAIMQDIGNLEHLSYLHFYFTKVEIMEHFIRSPAWKRIGSNKFKFVIGQDVQRIVDRVSGDVEHKFNEQHRCLRFVNGNEVPEAVENVLSYVTAFYLDHHAAVCSLSEFGITNSRQLSFCVVRECPNIEFIISENIDEPAYPSLEHLGLHYLWKLESICKNQLHKGSFRALKSLTVATCPKLEYIFSGSLVECFCNLEELIVEDCESLKEIIEKSDEMGNDDFSAVPRLRKVKLYYLPQLFRLLYEGERSLEDPLPSRHCQLESVTLHSCPKLDRSLLKQPLVKELIEEDYKLAT